ncbi:MAG: alanine racemase, partial [Pseudomonadota bacterium]|nr:alanine racemase [Pseudomonadota bacterium]
MSGRLEIDLGALAHNYCVLNRGKPETLAAVVKADAYGLGAVQVAKALWQQGCREYFVAQASEGVALRADLPNAAIYVLEGVTERS